MKKLLLISIVLLCGGCATLEDAQTQINAFVASPTGQVVTQYGITALGVGSSVGIVKGVGGDAATQAGTANDILTMDNIALTLLAGKTPPTQAQIDAAFASMKSNASTAAWDTIATQLGSSLTAFLGSHSGSNWTQYATWFIQGQQYGVGVYQLIPSS